jgi:hypothetical protein
MKEYVLRYIQTSQGVEDNFSSFWRCKADDYAHAEEQLRDEVERNQGEKVVIVERAI